MSIDSLIPENIKINTSGAYELYCRHTLEPYDCSICLAEKGLAMDNRLSFGLSNELNYGIDVLPYQRGMPLDGGLNLYGNRTTAILHEPSTDLSIHHHNLGGGSLNLGSDRITTLPWERQTKLNEFNK